MNDNLDPSLTGSATEDAVLLAASCVAIATLVPVLLYQTGAIRSLPDPPPSSLFASDKITKSKMARPFGIPDTIPGLLNFGRSTLFARQPGRLEHEQAPQSATPDYGTSFSATEPFIVQAICAMIQAAD